MVTLYNVYIRLSDNPRWAYGGTFHNASTAWSGAMMAREKGFVTRIVRADVPTMKKESHLG